MPPLIHHLANACTGEARGRRTGHYRRCIQGHIPDTRKPPFDVILIAQHARPGYSLIQLARDRAKNHGALNTQGTPVHAASGSRATGKKASAVTNPGVISSSCALFRPGPRAKEKKKDDEKETETLRAAIRGAFGPR